MSRVSLASVVGASLNWDQRKSQPAKGDYWACCPFHTEKTPSFHVDDRKGYYYCFGCHEKGNAITFLRATRNMSHREAVATLASMVGMELPRISPEERRKTDEADDICKTCEAAARYFEEALNSDAGAGVRSYLTERRVDERTRSRFNIGFAPAGGGALMARLQSQDFSEKQLLDAGLVAKSDRGGGLYCRFRNRLIFPIQNINGRIIAFGGRAMAANDAAKYLNSPETAVFRKGSCLYNHASAQKACRGDKPLLVVEGYMDVIALHKAGIESCVAPLGTAITESQLLQLWKMSPTPVLALDGDEAGLRAAARLARLAMPLLQPGRTLEFCLMPKDKDPDDVVNSEGAEAILQLAANAVPLADFVWQCESGSRNLSTPEGKAELEAELVRISATIKQATVKKYYQDHFRKLLGISHGEFLQATGTDTSFHNRRSGHRRHRLSPTRELKASPLFASDAGETAALGRRERFILAICLSVPAAVIECLENLEGLEMETGRNQEVLNAILSRFDLAQSDEHLFRESVSEEVGSQLVNALTTEKRFKALRDTWANGEGTDPARATMCLLEELHKLQAIRSAKDELSSAREIHAGEGEDNPTARVASAVGSREKARGGLDLEESGEVVRFENGVAVPLADQRAFERMLERGA